MPRTITLGDLMAAVSRDLATGKAEAIPIITAVADAAYKGNFVTEKIADWVTDHTGADAYRDLVKLCHGYLSKHSLTMED